MTVPEVLTAALANRYRIERPLGAGGMAIVYLAEDLKHHRKVALKVLKPEFADALGPQRFLNEINVVAQLNHPNILALYDSGEAEGFLYFVMPVAGGESLRAKLDRERPLSIDEAVRVTQQIASALDYAHRQGVIHRDVKPENILLHEGVAMVTDFGIALPVGDSSDTRLTEVGESLGTADYMSPEQSRGERKLDARSDVYALGCVLFEMLAGEPPFTGHNRQSVIGKRITEPPPRVTTRRAEVPEALGDVVTKALAMSPADRYESAAALAEVLAQHATEPASPLARINSPMIAASLFGVASLVILGVVYLIMVQLGLPDWVLRAAVGLLVIGLPIIVATALVERQRRTRADRQQHVWLNWRRAIQGGGLAFAGLAVLTAGFMGMRTLGIGPVGTLMAKGVLQSRDPILLAEFENQTSDPTLAATITGGLRIDLTQSRVVQLFEPASVSAALKRMVVDANAPLDEALARQVALREGIKAVLAGAVASVGRGYMLSARLVSPADGAVLHAVRANAKDDSELLAAIDQLSARVRERIGESLKDVRSSPALYRVTTSSLDALRKYTEAIRAADQAGDPEFGVRLLNEAVAFDTAFAMAYRKLGNVLGQDLGRTEASIAALTRAFELRDRLPEAERYNIEAYYYGAVDYDPDKRGVAYRSTLALEPDNLIALVNLASHLNVTRQWAEKESLALRAIEVRGIWQAYGNLVAAQALQGKYDDVQATIDQFEASGAAYAILMRYQVRLHLATRAFDKADTVLRELVTNPALSPIARGEFLQFVGDLLRMRGRVAEAERRYRDWMAIDYGSARDFRAVYHLATLQADRGGSQEATSLLDSFAVESLSAVARPYLELAEFHASAGRVERAQSLLAEYEAQVAPGVRKRRAAGPHRVNGEIALSEGRLGDAAKEFGLAYEASGACIACGLARQAHAWHRGGQTDSAVSTYERLFSLPRWGLELDDVRWLPESHRRLGELYEERNDTTNAVEHYNAFVELWKNADPELQPQVADVQQRIASLVSEAAGTP